MSDDFQHLFNLSPRRLLWFCAVVLVASIYYALDPETVSVWIRGPIGMAWGLLVWWRLR